MNFSRASIRASVAPGLRRQTRCQFDHLGSRTVFCRASLFRIALVSGATRSPRSIYEAKTPRIACGSPHPPTDARRHKGSSGQYFFMASGKIDQPILVRRAERADYMVIEVSNGGEPISRGDHPAPLPPIQAGRGFARRGGPWPPALHSSEIARAHMARSP